MPGNLSPTIAFSIDPVVRSWAVWFCRQGPDRIYDVTDSNLSSDKDAFASAEDVKRPISINGGTIAARLGPSFSASPSFKIARA